MIPPLYLLGVTTGSLPVGTGLFFFKRLTSALKILLLLNTLALIADVAMVYLAFLTIPNTWVQNYFTLIEYFLLSLVFLQWLTTKGIQIAIKSGLIIFICIWAAAEVTSHLVQSFDDLLVTVECIFVIAMAVSSLLTLSRDIGSDLFRNPRFWISGGVLLYFTGNLIIFALFSVILKGNPDTPTSPLLQTLQQIFPGLSGGAQRSIADDAGIIYWTFHTFLNLITNILYTSGYFLQASRRK